MSPDLIQDILIAIISAALAGFVSFIIHKRTRERKILKVKLSKPTELISIHESVKNAVQINLRGISVENASTFDFIVINSGNTTIENIDLVIRIFGDAEIIGGSNPQSNIIGVKSEDIDLRIEGKCYARLVTSHLNSGDQINGHIRMANVPTDIQIEYRSPGVSLKIIPEYDPYQNTVLYELIKTNILLDTILRITSSKYRKLGKIEKSVNE